MSKVVHFEIPVDDPERAIKFYTDTFGWKITKAMEDYWLAVTGEEGEPGINGALMMRKKSSGGKGSNSYICTISVKSLDETIEKVKAENGKVEMEKIEIPNVGWYVYAKDTEGNVFGILEPEM